MSRRLVAVQAAVFEFMPTIILCPLVPAADGIVTDLRVPVNFGGAEYIAYCDLPRAIRVTILNRIGSLEEGFSAQFLGKIHALIQWPE
ncbi:MAG TPA: hypothetical protein VGF13_13755 [Verrucomicrobiae bacterium]